jgi:hypothetical protein
MFVLSEVEAAAIHAVFERRVAFAAVPDHNSNQTIAT